MLLGKLPELRIASVLLHHPLLLRRLLLEHKRNAQLILYLLFSRKLHALERVSGQYVMRQLQLADQVFAVLLRWRLRNIGRGAAGLCAPFRVILKRCLFQSKLRSPYLLVGCGVHKICCAGDFFCLFFVVVIIVAVVSVFLYLDLGCHCCLVLHQKRVAPARLPCRMNTSRTILIDEANQSIIQYIQLALSVRCDALLLREVILGR